MKEEKINGLGEKRKSEKLFRDQTYDRRREQFRNEVSERRSKVVTPQKHSVRTTHREDNCMVSIRDVEFVDEEVPEPMTVQPTMNE